MFRGSSLLDDPSLDMKERWENDIVLGHVILGPKRVAVRVALNRDSPVGQKSSY